MAEVAIEKKPLHLGQIKARLIFKSLKKSYRKRVYLCGRRWGKTVEIKNLGILVIEKNFRVGLFCPEFKDVTETWETIRNLFESINKASNKKIKPYKIDATSRCIYRSGYVDVAEAPCFEFWSIGNVGRQDSGRGRKYNIVIYEETQKIDSDVLQHHFTEVTTAALADYKGNTFFFGTPPNSKLHYFYELICRGAQNNPEMANDTDLMQPKIFDENILTYRATTYDNPFIDKDELEDIKKSLPPLVFRQEFEAICVEYANRPFCHVLQHIETYNKVFAKNVIPFTPSKDVFLGFDFNKNPMAVTISQSYNPQHQWHTIKELSFGANEKGNIYDICNLIRRYFASLGYTLSNQFKAVLPFHIWITGDATGNTNSINTADNETTYQIILRELGLSTNNLRLTKANPRHSEAHAQANELLLFHPDFLIAKQDCPRLVGDLMNTSCTPELGIDKKKYDPHFFDAERYKWNIFLPYSIKRELIQKL
jgi:hypothetical protein